MSLNFANTNDAMRNQFICAARSRADLYKLILVVKLHTREVTRYRKELWKQLEYYLSNVGFYVYVLFIHVHRDFGRCVRPEKK